jgi:hypothetical protein
VKGKRRRGQANFSPGVQSGEHRLRRRISDRLDAGLKAGLLAGAHDVIVVSRRKFAWKQQNGLVLKAGERDGGGVSQAVPLAQHRGHRLDAQEFAADAFHRLGVQRQPDVLFTGKNTAGYLGAEQLAGDDAQIWDLVFDRGQDHSQHLEVGHRGIAQADLAGDARAGEPNALGRALERCECHRRFLE